MTVIFKRTSPIVSFPLLSHVIQCSLYFLSYIFQVGGGGRWEVELDQMGFKMRNFMQISNQDAPWVKCQLIQVF